MPSWIVTLGQWLYANVLGNEVAAILAVAAGAIWAHIKVIRPLHRRLDHQDAKLHAIHQATGGDGDGPDTARPSV